jgi:glycosyltransferase involved in cell wall biosynthesis
MADASRRPARIVYVDHATDIGGAEKSLLDLIARLDRARFEPTLLCAEGAEWLEPEPPAAVAIERVFGPSGVFGRKRDEVRGGLLGSRGDLLGAIGPVGRLWRRFRRLKPDIVHTNTLKAHLLAGASAHLARRRLVWHLRDILSEGEALRWLLRGARAFRPAIIAISEAVKQSLRGAYRNVRVIHNGTDLAAFHPLTDRQGARASLGLQPEEVAICIVGRLTPWKGHRELLQAFSEVMREVPRAKLLVVGEVAFWEDSYEAELKALAEGLGVAGRVSWLGFRRDVPDILGAADIFALPSVDEPFGRVVVEAMACEKPVVATRSGGVPEIMNEGETGILVPPGEVQALARALVTLARDADLRARMGQAGRQRALATFDVNRTAARVQELYEEILESRAE